MAINETISTGNKYRRLKDATNKIWQRISFWTKASDVEFDNGTTLEASLGNIQGITDSVSSTSSNIAASAKAVQTINSNLQDLNTSLTSTVGNINVYVGDDGLLHFTDKDGADTALNFNNFQNAFSNSVLLSNGQGSGSTNAATIGRYAIYCVGKNGSDNATVSIEGLDTYWSTAGITGDGGNRGWWYIFIGKITSNTLNAATTGFESSVAGSYHLIYELR